ncbi:MAG: AMP-binding protein [Halobacteriaceae archaeon]
MDVIGDLVQRSRAGEHDERMALRASGDPPSRYTYAEFRTTARKTGNYLSHHGVGPERPVGVPDDRAAELVLTLYGAALLGAPLIVEPADAPELAALVAPTQALEASTVSPGTARIGYGERPDQPDATLFGRAVWSENPGFPPTTVAPDQPILQGAFGSVSHRSLVAAGRRAADHLSIEAGEDVAVRATLTEPGTIAAGLVAPILEGATIVFPGTDEKADIAVVSGDAPEKRRIDPRTVEV